MAIIGISGSPIIDGNVDRMTKAILENSNKEYTFVNLSTLTFSPCRGCADLCAPTGMCGQKDELTPYIQQIKDAQAIVLASPMHRGHISAWMFSFISRLWCLAHMNQYLKDKPVVFITAGLGDPDSCTGSAIFKNTFTGEHYTKTIGEVFFSSKVPPCYTCGVGLECNRGGLWHQVVKCDAQALKNFKITPDLFKKWENDPDIVAQVCACAKAISQLQ